MSSIDTHAEPHSQQAVGETRAPGKALDVIALLLMMRRARALPRPLL